MKFKVGDRVKIIRCSIKTGLTLGESNCGCIGQQFTIKGYENNLILPTVDIFDYHNNYNYWQENELRLVTSSELKHMETTVDKAKYGVSWEENGDPTAYFKTLKGANDKIQELLDRPEVDKNTIYFFEVKGLKKVVKPIKYELVEV